MATFVTGLSTTILPAVPGIALAEPAAAKKAVIAAAVIRNFDIDCSPRCIRAAGRYRPYPGIVLILDGD
jgi:hypothetical protein